MLSNILKSQKTSNDLGNFYINDWQEIKKRIRINTLYLISCDL